MTDVDASGPDPGDSDASGPDPGDSDASGPDPGDSDASGPETGDSAAIDPETSDTVASADVGVEPIHVHVHRAVAGTFPLRVADVLFADACVLVVEYEYLTPLFGAARGGVADAGDSAKAVHAANGISGLVEHAERTRRVDYDDVDHVRLYDGGRFGRPKVAVDVADGPAFAYRVHAPVDVDALGRALDSLGDRRGFDVAHHETLGFSARRSLRRFMHGR